MIKVTLKDGSLRELDAPVSVAEFTKGISMGLYRNACCALVEGKVADEDVYVTRTYRDAPGVDGFLFLNTSATLMTGDFVKVCVTDCNEYDLIGEICED